MDPDKIPPSKRTLPPEKPSSDVSEAATNESAGTHLTIIGSGARRATWASEKTTPAPATTTAAAAATEEEAKSGTLSQTTPSAEQPAEDSKNLSKFRSLASRNSEEPAVSPVRVRGTKRDKQRAEKTRQLRLMRVWPRFARREIARFHARFSLRQILQFYIGIPAVFSIGVCIFILLSPSAKDTAIAPPRPPASVSELLRATVGGLRNENSNATDRAIAKLLELYPNDPRTYVAKGVSLASHKKYDEARAAFQHALGLSPDFPAAIMNLAELEFAAGNYPEALKHFTNIPVRLRNNPRIWFRIYLCYQLTNQPEEAEKLVRSGAFNTQSEEGYFVRAAKAAKSGDRGEAQRLMASAEMLFGEKAKAYRMSFERTGLVK